MGACVALVVAAGRGRRFGGESPKQYLTLCGRPIIRRAVECFLAHAQVDAVLAVIHPDDRALFEGATEGLDILAPVAEVPADSGRTEGIASTKARVPSMRPLRRTKLSPSTLRRPPAVRILLK